MFKHVARHARFAQHRLPRSPANHGSCPKDKIKLTKPFGPRAPSPAALSKLGPRTCVHPRGLTAPLESLRANRYLIVTCVDYVSISSLMCGGCRGVRRS